MIQDQTYTIARACYNLTDMVLLRRQRTRTKQPDNNIKYSDVKNRLINAKCRTQVKGNQLCCVAHGQYHKYLNRPSSP